MTERIETDRSPVVLVMDDDEAVRMTFRYLLENQGYAVLEAEDGVEGMAVFNEKHPDLVLADLAMPNLDGLGVLSAIRAIDSMVPVIMISGTGIITDVIKALRLGAWDYLLKPLTDFSMLNHTLSKNLERSRLLKENRAYQLRLEESLRQIRTGEEAGKIIQQKLLPPALETMDPYTLRHYFMASQYLSGDFLDYFLIDDEHIGFYTADVSGHGVSSALITVYLKSFIRKHLEQFHHQNDQLLLKPDLLLQQFNEQLLREELEKHLALFYAVLSTKDNTLVYTSAGQFPPAILWQNGVAQTLVSSDNTVVGLFPDVAYRASRLMLADEFFFAVFSDGILELMPQQSLTDKIELLKGLDRGSKIEAFMQSLAKRELPDDVTVLTVRRRL